MNFDFEKFKASFQEYLSLEVANRKGVQQQYGLILLIVGLFVVYINCGYQAQKQQRKLSELSHQVEEAHYEYLTISAQLVEQTRQSMVASRLQENGSKVKVSNKPAIQVD